MICMIWLGAVMMKAWPPLPSPLPLKFQLELFLQSPPGSLGQRHVSNIQYFCAHTNFWCCNTNLSCCWQRSCGYKALAALGNNGSTPFNDRSRHYSDKWKHTTPYPKPTPALNRRIIATSMSEQSDCTLAESDCRLSLHQVQSLSDRSLTRPDSHCVAMIWWLTNYLN